MPGEPIEIKAPTAAVFRRSRLANLLIIGSNQEIVFGMLTSALLSLPLFYRPGQAEFYLADLSFKDEEWADVCEQFRDNFGMYKVVVEEKNSSMLIEHVHELMMERKASVKADLPQEYPSLFMVVAGLHRIKDLKEERSDSLLSMDSMDSFGSASSPSSPVQKLVEVLRDGPELGINSIVWVNKYSDYENILGSETLLYFNQRVMLTMNEGDSQQLTGSDVATRIKDGQALLFQTDSEVERPDEKFIPYRIPSLEYKDKDGNKRVLTFRDLMRHMGTSLRNQ